MTRRVDRAHAAEVAQLHGGVESIGIEPVHRLGIGALGIDMQVKAWPPSADKIFVIDHGIIGC